MSASPGERGLEFALVIENTREQIEQAKREVLARMHKFGYPDAARFAVGLALEEAIVNAFVHGHRDLPDEPVRLDFAIDDRETVLTITDKGPGFNPDAIADPTLDENLDRPSGRGLFLMQAYMASVEHKGTGNCVCMTFKRTHQPPHRR